LGGITVGRDGPSNVYVPTSTGDWAQLGLPAPSHQWNCQESSGNLSDAIGSLTLTAANTPLYQQAVTGWTRKFVGTVDTTASQRFATTDASIDLASGVSVAWLFYASILATPAATRQLVQIAGNTHRIEITNTGVVRAVHNSVLASMAGSYADAIVRPWIWFRNNGNSTAGLITNLENKSNTFADGSTAAANKSLGTSGATVPGARFGLAAYWSGTDAQTIAQSSTLTTLGW
jgi:hypothetical protein